MPTVWEDLAIISIFVIPFLILHVFLSARRKMIWGFIVPTLWTAFGVWTIITCYMQESQNIKELIFFFLLGDFVYIFILLLIKHLRKKSSTKHKKL